MKIKPLKLTFFLIFIFTISAAIVKAEKSDYPFKPGEKLTFSLRWGIFYAGEAVLQVLPEEIVNKQNSLHFVLTTESCSFLDVFYKGRDRVDSYTDIDMTHSILYKKKINEGKTKRDVTVNFDWINKKAHYSNFNVCIKPIELKPGSFDPLSVFYISRLMDFDDKKQIEIPVTDGKKCVLGVAEIIKREKVKLKIGTFDTYLIEPELKHVGGVFEKSKNAKIQLWVSADKYRIPVKIKSKVKVGSFTGELISYESSSTL